MLSIKELEESYAREQKKYSGFNVREFDWVLFMKSDIIRARFSVNKMIKRSEHTLFLINDAKLIEKHEGTIKELMFIHTVLNSYFAQCLFMSNENEFLKSHLRLQSKLEQNTLVDNQRKEIQELKNLIEELKSNLFNDKVIKLLQKEIDTLNDTVKKLKASHT